MGVVLDGPPKDFIKKIKDRLGIRFFVETGTYMGNTCRWAAQHFENVVTIEAKRELYEKTSAKYSAIKNINFLHGNSAELLGGILSGIDSPAIFWLDAHWSGSSTYGQTDECPLLRELEIINEDARNHVILIDDARMFLQPPPPPHNVYDWPDINQVLNILSSMERYTIIKDDIIFSVPASEKDFVIQMIRPEDKSNEILKPKAESRTISPGSSPKETYSAIISSEKYTDTGKLRLHLGCGEQYMEGYVNIDFPRDAHNIMDIKADLFADIRNLDLPFGTVDEIRLHHVFEHFSRVTALALLIRWHQWLKPNGILHIETPDFSASARQILDSQDWLLKTAALRHLTGDQAAEWGYHIDQWTEERFRHTLSGLGYSDIKTNVESWDHRPYLSNVHAVARKQYDVPLSQLLSRADALLQESLVHPQNEIKTFNIWKKQLREILSGKAALSSTPGQPISSAANLVAIKETLDTNASKLPLQEIHEFNKLTRDRWVTSKAATVDQGSSVLDIGAGTCPYRPLFVHCNYKSHDFMKYEGVKRDGGNKYGDIDIVSDITKIPVPDSSMDAVLCTEVFEHLPEPALALKEISRILKPGGRAFLTAPLGSGLHQLPYHYYGGFSPEWYRHFADKYELNVNEITPNGGFFKLLAQECARVAWTFGDHKQLHGENAHHIFRLFNEWLPRYLFFLEDNHFNDQFTVGYHVELQKPVQETMSETILTKEEVTDELLDQLESDVRNTEIMYKLSLSYISKGHSEKAIRFLIAILELDPNHSRARQLWQKIKTTNINK